MGIEEQIDRLIDLGEEIRDSLNHLKVVRLRDALRAAGPKVFDAVADEPAKEQAEEPPKKWRILEPEEVVQEGDWVNAIANKLDEDPPGGGWIPARASVIGGEASQAMGLYVARPVAEEPAKKPEPEHPPDPGEGYRILSKNPPEELMPGDELHYINGTWVASDNARTHRRQGLSLWYRRKIEHPEPAWEPKVGDWVRVTRPENWREWKDPLWQEDMHQYDGKIFQIGNIFEMSVGERVRLKGIDWFFHRDWLSPAKPPEPEYREPVLPADAGEQCEFSRDGKEWCKFLLAGWQVDNNPWICERYHCWPYARIKVDA